MRVLVVALSLALLSACATGTGVRGTDGKDQVAAATAAWRAAYDSRVPARITAMYESDAVLWGTSAKTVAANPAAVAEYFKDAGKRPNARVAFGEQHVRVYGDVGVNTGYYTFSDVRGWPDSIRSCTLHDGLPESRRKVAHRRSSFIPCTVVRPAQEAFAALCPAPNNMVERTGPECRPLTMNVRQPSKPR